MNANEIVKVLDKLSEKIAGPAHQTWMLFVKQANIYGIVDVTVGILMLLFVVISLGVFFKRKTEEFDINVDSHLVMLVCSIVLIVFGIYLIVDGIMFLSNPGYYAINDLINAIR
jgi:amino acid transporter